MSVQQGTKAPFFLSLFLFALGAKAKTNGTARAPVRLLSLGNICLSKYHWVMCVKGYYDILKTLPGKNCLPLEIGK